MSFTLKRSEILRGEKAFEHIFECGKEIRSTHLRCLGVMRSAKGNGVRNRVKTGFAVSRAVRRAVQRNRIKRLMRESYRMNKELLLRTTAHSLHTLELVFIYAPPPVRVERTVTWKEIEKDMKTILSKITLQWLQ